MRCCCIALLLITIFFAGCAPPPEKTKRFFWPILSQDPKIEFIDSYISDYDVKKGKESRWIEVTMGREIPRLLFSRPFDIAVDGDSSVAYVVDRGRHKVWVLDMARHEIRDLVHPSRELHLFALPMAVAIGPDGGVFVSDSASRKIHYFDNKGVKRRKISSEQFVRPTGMAYDMARDRLYVTDTGRHQVLAFDGKGKQINSIGTRGAGPGQFNYPIDVDIAPGGELTVLDALNARVQVFTPDGKFLRAFGERGTALGSFSRAKGVAVDSAGHVYVTDGMSHKIVIFSSNGEHLLTIGGKHIIAEKGGVSPGGFYLPQGIDVDSKDGIWVCDSFNRAIYKFQYLNEDYLRQNPIDSEDFYFPAQKKQQNVKQ